jgi:predicted dehydrogenase
VASGRINVAKIRYGMVGFGGIAEARLAKEGFGLDTSRFSGNDVAELGGAIDVNPARESAARALGITWFPSYDALLADKGIGSVLITTNNASHFELARRALLAGKHVMVEKPLATKLADARELQRIARERSLSISADHMMTKNAFNIAAKKLVQKGAIGEVNDICLHMEFLYGSTSAEAASWRCSQPAELGGPIGDVGSHCLYMAEFLLGSEIVRVGCVYYPVTLDIRVENGAFIQFELANGIHGSARVAFNQVRGGLLGTLKNLGYEIYGSGGALRSYGTMFQLSGGGGEPINLRLEVEKENSLESVVPEHTDNIYMAQIAEHARSILAGTLLDAESAVRNLDLLIMCHESAIKGGQILDRPRVHSAT